MGHGTHPSQIEGRYRRSEIAILLIGIRIDNHGIFVLVQTESMKRYHRRFFALKKKCHSSHWTNKDLDILTKYLLMLSIDTCHLRNLWIRKRIHLYMYYVVKKHFAQLEKKFQKASNMNDPISQTLLCRNGKIVIWIQIDLLSRIQSWTKYVA